MKKIFTSKELLTIDEILLKYSTDVDTTVTGFELGLLTKLYEDYQQIVRRIDKLEAENNGLHKENKNLHCNINHLRQCNNNQYKQIKELEKQLTDITILYQEAHDYISGFEESEDRCATLEAENKTLNDKLYTVEEENRKLYEKVGELHTIKKSFEVLRALYLGDYEDEPF